MYLFFYMDTWVASPELVRSIVMEQETIATAPEDIWRLPYLVKLPALRLQLYTLEMEKEEERAEQLIKSLCIS